MQVGKIEHMVRFVHGTDNVIPSTQMSALQLEYLHEGAPPSMLLEKIWYGIPDSHGSQGGMCH